ncbi:hypothetical protein [Natrarchaeobius versutus]|uniref:hypothetical protein n=1 Tax=Natrarchaeobius versutus TaxID=1679078 RepID=UPI003510C350
MWVVSYQVLYSSPARGFMMVPVCGSFSASRLRLDGLLVRGKIVLAFGDHEYERAAEGAEFGHGVAAQELFEWARSRHRICGWWLENVGVEMGE